ncbi:acetyltransferase [Epilithonimonas zeae]|uniref:acetyltransferase n=1 Tax=Epilithonimonas zeae TaxID=1416779 RepID=UPI00200C49FD|nr:acetyltransferase [Epilithonimonas zeae]UQB70360.1 acetyltransferase [Epilithonimonas zeae]
MIKKICIIGAGGFGREIYYSYSNFFSILEIQKNEIFFMDDNLDKLIKNQTKFPIMSFDEFNSQEYHVIIGVGNPLTRKSIVERLPTDTSYLTLIHENALIMDDENIIGEGGIVTAGSIITTNVMIGKHSQINLNTTIGHDCIIGDYFTTAPGVNISGDCKFGNNVYFGTNATVKNGVEICDNVTIGMGAVVTKNIHQEGVYIGNPLRKLEKII